MLRAFEFNPLIVPVAYVLRLYVPISVIFKKLKILENTNSNLAPSASLETRFLLLVAAFSYLQKLINFYRHNNSLKIIDDEFNLVTSDMIVFPSKTILKKVLSNYELNSIFNADEFGIFYQCLPNKTYLFKGKSSQEIRVLR